jgi:hypothetical protein
MVEYADEPLFIPTRRRGSGAGRVRRALDVDVRAARATGATLPAASVAALRVTAERIDALEHALREPTARAYDHVPLAGLLREFREACAETFAVAHAADDPLARALERFLADDDHPAGGSTPVVDPAGSVAPQ